MSTQNASVWWDQVAEDAPESSGVGGYDFDAQVIAAYEKYLGRTPSKSEIDSHRGNPGGASGVVQVIKASPEAAAYAKKTGSSAIRETDSGVAGAPPEGWAAWFKTLTDGKPPTPATLIAMEAELQKYGVKVVRNSAGIAGKIQLPSGQYIDVIQGASRGGEAWQWSDASEAGGGYTGGGTPWGERWQYKDWTPPPEFSAPDANAVLSDHGFQARLKEGRAAIERSAAAKGTLLTGGTVKGLEQFSQDYASNEYGNAWQRAKSEYDTRYGNRLSDYTTNYAKDQDAYKSAYQEWMTKDMNAFQRPYLLSQLGFNAANTKVPSGGA